jgi:hypothetical protein
LGRGIFPGESQPVVIDVDDLIDGVDDPDEAARIEGLCHSSRNPWMGRGAKAMHRAAAPFPAIPSLRRDDRIFEFITIKSQPKKFQLTPGSEYFRVTRVEEINKMQSSWLRNQNFYFSYYFTGPGVRLDF